MGLVSSEGASAYDHGPGHPLNPHRVLLTLSLIRAYGLDGLQNVSVVEAAQATEDDLELVHTGEYIEAVRSAGHGHHGPWRRFGLGPGDNPVFDRMHEAAASVTGATLAAASGVWTGKLDHAFNAAGGLHHAMPGRASGFCVYDDPAIAIAWLLGNGAEKIAYVDVDVHHGDGPQAIFWNEPRVLTTSIHEYAPDLFFFPGTGSPSETGGPGAPGSALNAAMRPGARDDEWLEALRGRIIPAVRAFEPDVLVTQLGCDTHATDPLAHLALTTSAYVEAYRELHDLAHSAASGRWIATGGGGYQWARVVPRAWTLAFAEMADGAELADELPPGWVAEAQAVSGQDVPRLLLD